MEEKRFHPRLAVPLQAGILLQGTKRLATLENLSAGGAAVRLTEEVAEGTELDEISFTLPSRDELGEYQVSARATVVRIEPAPQPHGAGGHVAGIRFDGLPEEHHQRIQQYIYRNLTKGQPSTEEIPLERRRVTIEQPISIRFGRFDDFVEEVSENISAGGMFICTNAPKPPGTIFSFQFQLGDDFSLIEGRAEVVWTRKKSLGQDRRAGMGIRFLELDERSRNTILRLVQEQSGGNGADEPKKVSFNVASVTPTMRPTSAPRELELVDLEVAEEKAESSTARSTHSQAEDLRSELARRTKAYEDRIGKLEGQIAKLTSAHVDDEGQLLASKSSMAELQNLNELLKQQLEEARARVGHQGRDVHDQLEAANRDLEELRKKVHSGENEGEANRRKAAGLENRLLAVEQALRHSEREREDLSLRLRESAKQQQEFEQTIEALTSDGQSAQHEAKLEELRLEAEEKANRATALEDRLSVAEQERDEALAKIAALAKAQDSSHQVTEQAERDLEELRSALSEAQDELARVQRDREIEVTELTREVEAAQSLGFEMREVREQLEGVQSEREALREQLEQQVLQLETDLENSVRSRHEVEASLRQLEEEFERAQDERQELESGLRQEAMAAVAAADETRESVKRLESSLAEAERVREELQAELEASRAEMQHLQSESDRAQAELRREAENAVGSAGELGDRVKELETSLEEAETSQQDLVNQIESAKSRSRKAEESLTGARSEIDQLRSESAARIAELEGQLAQTEQEREELAGKVAELEGSLARAEEDAKEHEQEWREAEERLAARVEEEKGAANELRAELKSLVAAGSSADQRVGKMRAVISGLESNLEKTRSEVREQASQAGEAESGLRRELEEAAATEHSLKEKLTELENSSRREREQRESLASDLDEAETEREALKEQVLTLQTAVRGFAAELEEQGRPVDLQAALAGPIAEESSGKGRWVRAAGLVAAGLLAGILLVGPASKFMPFGSRAGSSSGESAVESVENSLETADGVATVAEAQMAAPEPGYPAAGEVVQAWADAWAGQRVEDYLWFYARGFSPPNGASRPAWEAYRRERLEAPSSIQIALENLSEESLDESRTRVTFEQAYSADSYSDRVLKTLVMVKEDDSWKILSEQSEPL
jgi:uncharacterized protein (TIGR02266 family)